MAMEREWMRHRLPEKPPEGLVVWTKMHFPEDLGGEYLVFQSVRVPVSPPLEEIMMTNSIKPRYEWAAECTCSACRETFITQKITHHDGIRLAVGEDSMPYTLDPGEPLSHGDYTNHLVVEDAFAGEKLVCPICLSEVELVHRRSLRGGRTKRIMVQTVQNVEGYTTVFYWMVYRHTGEEGFCYTGAEPMDAYVLTERGGLVRYTHVQRNQFGYSSLPVWRECSQARDTHDSPYRDWGSINSKKVGTAMYDEEIPELDGATGEKTGLPEFIEGGGFGLVQYLKFWRRHRTIENVLKAGQAQLVAEIFKRANRYCFGLEAEMEKYLDLKKAKPHEMLRMTKEEFRQLRKQNRRLRPDVLDLFQKYKSCGGQLPVMDFLDIWTEAGRNGLDGCLKIMHQTPCDLPRIARYMEKQKMKLNEVQYLVDTRRMAAQLFAPRELTQEELWPRNLWQTHERYTKMLREQRELADAEKRKAMDGKFLEVAEKYAHLQWTDGDLCIILPRSAGDLHREGDVLRHCVGGYSDRHISGSDTIFFVRHYRRPERPYYTLDIRMNAGLPTEVQLHGYGNERHGKYKEHAHSIPKKVRDFVNRWKRDILIPWYIETSQKEAKEKSA